MADYLDGVRRNVPRDTGSGYEPMSFKITPGKLNSQTTNNGAITGTITPTNQTLMLGPDMSMTATISRKRVIPQ